MYYIISRPYACKECGKSYKDSASFKRHRLTHTGERPYPCTLCNESFIDSKLLKKHRELHHPDANPYPEEDDDGEIIESEANTSNEDTSGRSESELSVSSSSKRKKSSNNSSFGSNTSSTTSIAYENGGISKHEKDEEAEIEKEMEDDEEENVENALGDGNEDCAKEVGKVEDEEEGEDKEEKS